MKHTSPSSLLQVMRTQIPSENSPRTQRFLRRLSLFFLILLCGAFIVYGLMTYNPHSIVSSAAIFVILVIHLAVDFATGNARLASLITSLDIVPIFLCVLLSRTGGVISLLWAILLPPICMLVCGLLPGLIVSLIFQVFFTLAFYTPLGRYVPNIYPAEVTEIYPLVFLFVLCLTFFSIFNHAERSSALYQTKQEQEAIIAKANADAYNMIRHTIMAIISAVDAKDNYTRDHSIRVAKYSAMLAEQLGWDNQRIEELYQSALLHDIGKIGVDDAILKKKNSLTSEEYEVIKKHTVIGANILKDLKSLPKASVGALGHHERYDGKGYPQGLVGTWIPLEARIICIADSFDAMNSSRVYRKKLTSEDVLRELQNGAGTQFDPKLVKFFIPIAKKIMAEEVVE